MTSSIEAGSMWSTVEDVHLCCAWAKVSHDPLTGCEMKFAQMWKLIHTDFVGRSGSPRTESSLQSRWKILNRELTKWKEAKKHAQDNYVSGTNLSDETLQAQGWFMRELKKRFIHHECWEVVKMYPKFRIIPSPPNVPMNDSPLQSPIGLNSPMDSPISMQATPTVEPPLVRPMGKKKAKKAANAVPTESQKLLQQIAMQGAMSLEIERKRDEAEQLRDASTEREREYAHKLDQDRRDREVMRTKDADFSPNTQKFWREERRDVMRRRRLFREGGPSNVDDGPSNVDDEPTTTDWFNST